MTKILFYFVLPSISASYFDTMMEKYTIKAPSKRKYHRDGTLLKVKVMHDSTRHGLVYSHIIWL